MKRLIPYLVLLIGCSACVNDLKKVEELNERSPGVEVAKDVKTYYYGVNGRLKGVLTAPVLYRYMRDTPYMELNEGLRVDFYDDSMRVKSVLTAKKGEYFENSNNITVSDSVVVTSLGGTRILRTDELHWDPKKQQFYTYKPATLTTPDRTILGQNGLTASADLSRYKFMKVSGILKMDSGYYSPTPPDTGKAVTPVSRRPKDSGDLKLKAKEPVTAKDTITQKPGT